MADPELQIYLSKIAEALSRAKEGKDAAILCEDGIFYITYEKRSDHNGRRN